VNQPARSLRRRESLRGATAGRDRSRVRARFSRTPAAGIVRSFGGSLFNGDAHTAARCQTGCGAGSAAHLPTAPVCKTIRALLRDPAIAADACREERSNHSFARSFHPCRAEVDDRDDDVAARGELAVLELLASGRSCTSTSIQWTGSIDGLAALLQTLRITCCNRACSRGRSCFRRRANDYVDIGAEGYVEQRLRLFDSAN